MTEFRILGPLEVIEDGQAIDLGGQKQRALLAALLLEPNRVVSSDRLIEALWSDRPTETAAKALQVYVSQLRKLIGRERLETKPPGYLLRLGPDEMDLDRCRLLAEQGRPGEALALWRGPPLADFAYEPFAQAEIARLEELRLGLLEERVEQHLSQGRHADLVGELDTLVAAHPLRERLRRQLILALYRSGRQAEALDAYQAARAALVDELGIEPTRELRELHQSVLNQDPALDLKPAGGDEGESVRGSFVGREKELAALTAGLDDAFAGRGRLFLLAGEPGIGKSRLADELMARARGRGARVLVGRCWEAGGAPAYWPWVQSLRTYVHASEPDSLRAELGAGAVDLAQLLPELREAFVDLGEPAALESEGARFRLFEAVAGFLTTASRARPIVLVLDDLHAADEPSLLLLRFLARELGASRLLVVGAYRDVDPTLSQAMTAAATELGREPATRSIALRGLDVHDVSRFIELVSGEPPSVELAATIHAETEGNPLFVGEIVRLLAAEGWPAAGERSRFTIPQSVRDVISRRLGHLSEQCNRVLVLASVLGREFAFDTLAEIAGVDQVELLDSLDEAVAARVVSDLPGATARLRFSHVLIRDTLYEGLTTARRVRLHRLVVDVLEAGPGTDDAGLAHHAIAGSDFEKGLVYSRRAGDRAIELLAYEEAARLYAMALDALDLADPGNEHERCLLLLSLGEAQIRAGNTPESKATFLEAADIARRNGLGLELARAAAGYGGRSVWARVGADNRLVPLLEEGLLMLDEADTVLRARLLARLAGALRDEPSRARREGFGREAVEVARRTGEPAALAYALDGLAAAILAPDTLDDCLVLGGELCDVARRSGDRERLLHGHLNQVMAHAMLGNMAEAAIDLEIASAVAEELRQPIQLWHAAGAHAMMALAEGRLPDAERLIEEAIALGERAQPEMSIPVYRLQRYTLCDFRGSPERVAEELYDLAMEYPARPAFRCVVARLHAQLGRSGEAARVLNELSPGDFSKLLFDQEWLFGMSFLVETCVSVQDSASGSVLYRLLGPWGGHTAADYPEGIRGSIWRYLGLLAGLLGRDDEAAQHFERALEMNARMGLRPWLAYTQDDYARLLRDRDASGDRERAQELAAAARATYEELGMRPPS